MQKMIDAHFHIFDDSLFHLAWMEGIDALNPYTPEKAYHAAWQGQDRYEVIGGVHIETDALPEDKKRENAYFISRAKDPDSMVKGVAIYSDLLKGNTKEDFKEYLKEPVVKSVRYVLHNPDEPRGLCLDPKFIENTKTLGEMGILFDACLRGEEMADLYELAKQCPGTHFVVNHMGMVDVTAWKDENRREYKETWIDAMKKIAALPNTSVKVSGLSSTKVEDIEETVNFVLDIFGEDRVMYASNFPVCTMNLSLNDWAFAMLDITEKRGKEYQDKFFYQNAERIYRLK